MSRSVFWSGFKPTGYSRSSLASERPVIGFLWQDYRQSNYPWLSIVDNIAFPLRLKGHSRNERKKAAYTLLDEFAPDIPRETPVYQLSGGQQQVIALLRTICAGPDLFLADEPFSAFDQTRSWDFVRKFEGMWLRRKIPSVWVCHDIDEALLLADRVGLLSKRKRGFAEILENSFPRPRDPIKVLRSGDFINQRNRIIEFLANEY